MYLISENDKRLLDEFKSVNHISQTSMPYYSTPVRPLSDTSISMIHQQPTPSMLTNMSMPHHSTIADISTPEPIVQPRRWPHKERCKVKLVKCQANG